jgi:hypothetical protein
MMTLEDFDSSRVKINKVPRTASQTCRGQVLIRPVVDPIPFVGVNRLPKATVKRFKLTAKDKELVKGIKIHKFDHVA